MIKYNIEFDVNFFSGEVWKENIYTSIDMKVINTILYHVCI